MVIFTYIIWLYILPSIICYISHLFLDIDSEIYDGDEDENYQNNSVIVYLIPIINIFISIMYIMSIITSSYDED